MGHTSTGEPPAVHRPPPAPPLAHKKLSADRLGKPGAPPAWRRDPDAAAPAARPRSSGFLRFRINWGLRDGADPRRILAHVCRRGDIDSRMVGGIAMQASSSTFEVAEAIARSFAKRVQKRDRRDPHLFIVPDDHG
jgi:ATP-dependent RNA helicase DeaD